MPLKVGGDFFLERKRGMTCLCMQKLANLAVLVFALCFFYSPRGHLPPSDTSEGGA